MLLCRTIARVEKSMAEYDIVIRGGRVVNGAGNPWFWADVAVKDGRIARIGNLNDVDAARTIDVDGMVVCPGFIDMHTHSDIPLVQDGLAQSKVRQGVTLDVIGESATVSPVAGHVAEEYRQDQLHRSGVEVDWTDFDGYFARLMRQGISMNVASSVSPQQIKRAVVGFENRAATPNEQRAMNDYVDESMRQGAVGLCTAWHGGGPEFPDEVMEMAHLAASYGGYYGTHVGSEGEVVMEELEKALYIGRSARIPVHIYHLKSRGRANWPKVPQIIQAIEEARAQGLDVTANQYPYTAMQHPWYRLVPRWVQDAPRKEAAALLGERAYRDRVKQDPEFHQYIDEHGGWEGIVATVTHNPALKQYEGKTAVEIARMMGQSDIAEAAFDLIHQEGNFPYGVYHNMAEDDVKTIMQRPWVSIGSDGSAVNLDEPGVPHPRSFGTNVRVLGKYVREEGVLRLEDAIRKMTSLPGQTLGVRDRALLREGFWADIVVFDPARVAERATFLQPKQYPVGIEYVLVNGTVVVDQAEHTGARPGAVIYGPGHKSRHPRPLV